VLDALVVLSLREGGAPALELLARVFGDARVNGRGRRVGGGARGRGRVGGELDVEVGAEDEDQLDLPPLDLSRLGRLTFEAPDPARFPAFTLAYSALELGGTAPAALSGADEAAVEAFLRGRCPFTRIARVCEEVLDAHVVEPLTSVEQALAASDWGRREAARRVGA
jgi:1-deoxy-D-xylulose-5-phosphate reductoisomerase